MAAELAVKVFGVVVLPDHLVGAGMADALDHAGVVQRVRQDHRAGDAAAERRERGPVRDIARGEDQRGLLAVQVGQLGLQQGVVVVGARDVAGAARARAAGVDRLLHRLGHLRVLAHAEIVVGAPDGDLARAAVVVVHRPRKGAALAFQIGEDAVVAVVPQLVELGGEKGVEVHGVSSVSYSFRVWARAASSARVSRPAAAGPSASVPAARARSARQAARSPPPRPGSAA
jgi:hypothetical protein